MNEKVKRGMRRIGGSCLFVVTLFYLLVLVSFDCNDAGWLHTGMHENVTNICGVLGASLADFSLSFLGLMAFLIPLGLFWQGYLLITGDVKSSANYGFFMRCLRCISAITVLISASTFCYLYVLNTVIALPRNNGGIVGQELGEFLISKWGNSVTSCIVVSILFLSSTVYMRISWLNVSECIGKYILLTGRFLYAESVFLFKTATPVQTLAQPVTEPHAVPADYTEKKPVKSIYKKPSTNFVYKPINLQGITA